MECSGAQNGSVGSAPLSNKPQRKSPGIYRGSFVGAQGNRLAVGLPNLVWAGATSTGRLGLHLFFRRGLVGRELGVLLGRALGTQAGQVLL